MDIDRLRKLSGVSGELKDDLAAVEKELTLLEKMYQGRNKLNIDTDDMDISEIERRMEAASRGLSIVNRIKDPEYRKKHASRVLSNMNTIRAALNYMIRQMEDYDSSTFANHSGKFAAND